MNVIVASKRELTALQPQNASSYANSFLRLPPLFACLQPFSVIANDCYETCKFVLLKSSFTSSLFEDASILFVSETGHCRTFASSRQAPKSTILQWRPVTRALSTALYLAFGSLPSTVFGRAQKPSVRIRASRPGAVIHFIFRQGRTIYLSSLQ